MPATYTPITLDQMRETLKEANGWTMQSDRAEYVFIRDVVTIPGVQIKVYSSVRRADAHSRGAGQDAIRVCAIRKVGDQWQGMVKSSRVHRTQGWRENLMARIQTVFDTCKERASWTR